MTELAVDWLVENLDLYGFEVDEDVSDKIQKARKMENDQRHASIDKQVSILKDTLEEMMTGFDSEEDRMDFILDICNGYKKRITV